MPPSSSPTPIRHARTSAREKTKESVQEEKQVIVHCRYTCHNPYGMLIRVWPSTYLIARDIQHTSDLVHVENIPLAPAWMPVGSGESARFTLIFTGLPGSCTKFDLAEIIPQSGGFHVPDILRNDMDVYEVEIPD